MSNNKALTVQVRFGVKDQYRYKKVIDILNNEKLPERMKNQVAKELMLIGASVPGVTLEKLLTGEAAGALEMASKEQTSNQEQDELVKKAVSKPKVSDSIAKLV